MRFQSHRPAHPTAFWDRASSALQRGARALQAAGLLTLSVISNPSEAATVEYDVAGLAKDAQITVDKYGVPHIYAQTHYDAFFAQGFNAARDRLWQIDTWRRRGLGQLSEVLGSAYLQQDRANRLFLYRGDMYREWLAYGSDAKKITESFTAGINAYIDLIDRQPELMPPEFGVLDYAPSKWAPEDVVRIRSHGLWRNVASEVKRARLRCREDGATLDGYRKVLEPDWQTQLPDGLDPCAIPENVLDTYLLATAGVDFDAPEEAVAVARKQALREDLGSNNWAIAPQKSTTGRPILADDPHRRHAVPSLRYISHLSAPGLDVIGAGEPALPGISIGHNGTIAFGLTIFPIDQEDLYVYALVADPAGEDPAGDTGAAGDTDNPNDAAGDTDNPNELEDPAGKAAGDAAGDTDNPNELEDAAGDTDNPNELEDPAGKAAGDTDNPNETETATGDTDPEDGEEPPALTGYVYQGHFEPIKEITETIANRDGDPLTVTLQYTRHGPLIYRDDSKAHAFAVRAAWLEPGMAPYFGSIEYMRAKSWREFVAALNRWGAPSENQVYADTEGNIGYKPAGLFPKRTNFDGLLPVPGDGRFEWDGYWDMDVLPQEYNPERGWVGTANALTLPPDYDINKYRVGFEWTAPWRQARLTEVLGQDGKLSPNNAHALQRDYTSVLARRVLNELPPVLPRDSEEPHAKALRYLQHWKGRLNPSSGPAALYAIWFYRHLTPQLAAALSNGLLDSIDSLVVLEQMRNEPTIVANSLSSAWDDAVSLLGDDPEQWQWGKLHQMEFRHPLLGHPSLAQSIVQEPNASGSKKPSKETISYELAAYPRGGSGNTTNNTYFLPENFKVRSGASFRMVLDVGNWDKAYMTNAPGQSGDPRSPFYSNLLDGWAKDKKFPLLYSRFQVERNAATRFKLRAVSN